MTNAPIYGYRKASDTNQWVIDEEAAAIVRRIYRMSLDGMGPYRIARKLTEDKVEKPSYYALKHGIAGSKSKRHGRQEPYIWCGSTVTGILSRLEYCGHTVNFRTSKASYKDKGYRRNDPDNWKIFEHTHAPIIDRETFDAAQRLKGTPRRIDTTGEANPLTGLVFCADCGAKLYNSRKSKTPVEKRCVSGKVYTCVESDLYTCSTYNIGRKRFKETCTMHYIRTVVLRELVLDAIRRVSGYVRENEADFVEKVRKASAVRHEEEAKSHEKQIAKNERRTAEINSLFRKLYEDNANGKLSDERYEQLSASYEQEQVELNMQTAELQAELDAFVEDSQKADWFIHVVRRHTAFDELTNAMLGEFVAKILVHEADKSSGERVQRVDVRFNFIGNFDVPCDDAPPTEEEIKAERLRKEKLARQRESNRRWYAKKKAEMASRPAAEAGERSLAEA